MNSNAELNNQNQEATEQANACATTRVPRTKLSKTWRSDSYEQQSRHVWPGRGQHILAQYDNDTVVVYQAFKESIANYAVKHQKFSGCPDYCPDRMTWIKTNYLWMMFRSNWGSKHNQTHILAIWLHREAFDRYLQQARCKGSVRGAEGTVRLQWDPDHFPNGHRHPYRRAVQLGLKRIGSFSNGEDIACIQDISEYVRARMVARERVYVPHNADHLGYLGLSPPPAEAGDD